MLRSLVGSEMCIRDRGSNYLGINSRGYVPALDIGESEPLTEASVIVQYLSLIHI